MIVAIENLTGQDTIPTWGRSGIDAAIDASGRGPARGKSRRRGSIRRLLAKQAAASQARR